MMRSAGSVVLVVAMVLGVAVVGRLSSSHMMESSQCAKVDTLGKAWDRV